MHQNRLGNFQLQALRRQAGQLEGSVNRLNKPTACKLSRRDIHRYVNGSLPLRCLLAGRPEDPSAELNDQATLFGQRDELCGSDEASFRVAPPYKRLERDDLLRRCLDDRLIMELELLGSE